MKITNFLFSRYEKSLLTNIVPANSLADKISNGLLIHSRELRKYFPELLAGKTDWIEAFENNHFYNEPREISIDEQEAYQRGS